VKRYHEKIKKSINSGHFYLQRIPSPLSDPGIHEYDILSKEGYYLYRTTFPSKPLVIKKKELLHARV